MSLTIKLDTNRSSFQIANSAPPTSVTDSAIAPSARMACHIAFRECCGRRGRGACFHDMLCATSCVCMRLAGGCVWLRACRHVLRFLVGARGPLKNPGSHIDASHSRQPFVKGERLVRYEVNAVMPGGCRQGRSSKTGATNLVSIASTEHPVARSGEFARGSAHCRQTSSTAAKDVKVSQPSWPQTCSWSGFVCGSADYRQTSSTAAKDVKVPQPGWPRTRSWFGFVCGSADYRQTSPAAAADVEVL